MKTPITSKTLKSILKKGEDYKTEFKESVHKNLDRELVAFANSSGGRIYISITDKGEIKGINITNKLKTEIQDIAKNCDPKIELSFQEIKKEKVLIIEVKESKDKPHKCTSGFYIRSGASSQKLSRNEIWNFMEEEELFRFDRQICKRFKLKEHFDKEKLFFFMDRTEVEYNKKHYIQILENLEVIKKQNSKILFNNAGVLFFSKNLDKFFSHASVSCVLFKGTDKHHDIIDRKIFNRDIINNIEDSVDFLKKHLRLEYHFPRGQLRRKEVLEIPEDALREALINAVTHRNYLKKGVSVTVEIFDNRVEIYNFGALPKDLKRSDFGKRSSPRNQLIADLMLRAKYIEKMGTGIKKMRKLVRKAGLKPIGFDFTTFTTIIFHRKSLSDEKFISKHKDFDIKLGIKGKKRDNLLKLLVAIEKEEFLSTSFAKKEGITLRTVENYIKFLKDNKFIYFEGARKTGEYKVAEKYKKLKF